jgi:hypothetical protein
LPIIIIVIKLHFASQTVVQEATKYTLLPKQHQQAHLGELGSFPEPVPDVAA